MKDITLQELLDAGCHFGHQAKRWHPKMKQYIYGVRDGVHIFDLVKTRTNLLEALAYVEKIAAEGKVIVFVGTKRQAQAIVSEEAKKAGFPYVAQRWLGGTITNWEQIKKSIEKLIDMSKKREEGEYKKKYTKREQGLIDQTINRLQRRVGGLVDLKKAPDVLFVVDVKNEFAAVHEAGVRGVIVVGMVDTNTDPDLASYVIPANDDAVGSIKLIVSAIGEAAKNGKDAYERKVAEEVKMAEKKEKQKLVVKAVNKKPEVEVHKKVMVS